MGSVDGRGCVVVVGIQGNHLADTGTHCPSGHTPVAKILSASERASDSRLSAIDVSGARINWDQHRTLLSGSLAVGMACMAAWLGCASLQHFVAQTIRGIGGSMAWRAGG